MIHVRLPWPPSINHYWRSRVNGKRVTVYLGPDGKRYRRDAVAAWLRSGSAGRKLSGDIAVRLSLVFPDHHRRDIDNVCKAVLDAVAHAGGYQDDSQIKLLIVEHRDTEAPGWVDVTLGPKPGTIQGTLFETDFFDG